MGLLELSSLAGIISAALGGGSLLVSILPFFQLKGRYESLRKALRGIQSAKDEGYSSIYGDEADWSELVRWLDRGEVILAVVQQRVLRRALIAAAAIAALVVTISMELLSAKGAGLVWREAVVFTIVAIGPRLAFLKNWLLTDAEKKFLENFRDLDEAFYRREVAPKIDLFNAVFDRLFQHVSGSAAEELAIVQAQLRELSERVSRMSATSPKIGDARLPPATK